MPVRKPLKALSVNIAAKSKAVSGGRLPPAGPKTTTRYGPKPKPFAQRVFTPRAGPVKRVKRSYRKAKKHEVLMFMIHHLIYCDISKTYRPPNQVEAASYFKIPQSTISGWCRSQEKIQGIRGGCYRADNVVWRCSWPEMEEALFKSFVQCREEGKLVRRGWFRRQSKQIFENVYPDVVAGLFVFSTGWFLGFQRRWGISCRVLTKKASRVPDEYRRLILSWLEFNRSNSLPINTFDRLQLTSDIGRYRYSNILNIDETPIPFEYLEGRTYDFTGNTTISGKTARSGWDKRQATLILYLFADGKSYIKPKLIFAGTTGPKATIKKSEGHLYHPDVTVEFNPTAYNNEDLILKSIQEEIIPALGNGPSLLLLDTAAFHTTPDVLQHLQSASIIPSLIPGGCTGLIQPLDTAINKPFKQYLREYTEDYIDNKERENPGLVWSVGDRRVMTTQVVGPAWTQFCKDKEAMIQKAFRDVGVTLPVDGSRDHELQIKGFAAEDLKIGTLTGSDILHDSHALPEEPAEDVDSIVFTLRTE